MNAALKNKIAKLATGKKMTLADHGGAEVSKTGKGQYALNGQPTGDLEKTIFAIEDHAANDHAANDHAANAAEATSAAQVAAYEQQLDQEAAEGGSDNNEPLEAEQITEPQPDAEPGDNADAAQIAAEAPAAEWPTAPLSADPLTEPAVDGDGKLRTLTPAAIMVAAAALATRPLPALVRLGAGGDPKARYYPGEIIGYEPENEGFVSVRLTGKDRAENRPFQLIRVQKTDGTTDVIVKHKVSRRTICIATATLEALIAQRPKRVTTPSPARATNSLAALQTQADKANAEIVKAQQKYDAALRSLELAQAAAAPPAVGPSDDLRAEAEAKGVTFSDPGDLNDPHPNIEDAGEFSGETDNDPQPQPQPTPQPTPQGDPEEFAGNDAPPPAEFEIIEAAAPPALEMTREPIEEDGDEEGPYQPREIADYDHLLIAA